MELVLHFLKERPEVLGNQQEEWNAVLATHPEIQHMSSHAFSEWYHDHFDEISTPLFQAINDLLIAFPSDQDRTPDETENINEKKSEKDHEEKKDAPPNAHTGDSEEKRPEKPAPQKSPKPRSAADEIGVLSIREAIANVTHSLIPTNIQAVFKGGPMVEITRDGRILIKDQNGKLLEQVSKTNEKERLKYWKSYVRVQQKNAIGSLKDNPLKAVGRLVKSFFDPRSWIRTLQNKDMDDAPDVGRRLMPDGTWMLVVHDPHTKRDMFIHENPGEDKSDVAMRLAIRLAKGAPKLPPAPVVAASAEEISAYASGQEGDSGAGIAATQKQYAYAGGQEHQAGEETAASYDEPQEERQQGPISNLIDRINQFRDLKNFSRTLRGGGAAEGAAGAEAAAGGAEAALAGAEGAAAGAEGAVAATGGLAAFFASPIGWIVIVVVLFIVLLIIILAVISQLGGNGQSQPVQPTTIPGLSMQLSGPDSVANGQDISYTLTASYTGSSDIIFEDVVPTNATLVSASGTFTQKTDSGGKVASIMWSLKDTIPQTTGIAAGASSSASQAYTFTLTLHPEQNDVLVKNKILARIASGIGPVLPNPNSTDFDSLMRGQGRNVNVLGDETSFVQRILASGEKRIQAYENLIRQAYREAVAQNVNPLILIALWGEESGYDTTGRYAAMGCDPRQAYGTGKDFSSQLGCAVRTWNTRMTEYNTKAAKEGVPVKLESKVGKTCQYDDEFLYAAEIYGPTCVIYDQNDYFHRNFYLHYKKLLGQ